jgi:Zn-dependent protease
MDIFTLFHFIVLIFSIVIHEVSHGYAAFALGDHTAKYQGRLTLNPIKHIDPMGSVIIPAFLILSNSSFLFGWAKPVPYNPYNLRNQKWGEAIVAAAGPGVNILIAVIFGAILRLGGVLLSPTFILLAQNVILVNLLLAVFNLIPIPPLDGSKILHSVLPWRVARQYEKLEEKLFMFGPVAGFIIVFIVLSFIWPFFYPVLSWLFTLIAG